MILTCTSKFLPEACPKVQVRARARAIRYAVTEHDCAYKINIQGNVVTFSFIVPRSRDYDASVVMLHSAFLTGMIAQSKSTPGDPGHNLVNYNPTDNHVPNPLSVFGDTTLTRSF
ncbi:unnamed protein product [Somion occarium]|uniref:Uncharacterized protein n=1 Tax=Somion occarium TaxID=3059160 RepID=A0ABP1EAE2_9APHY